MKLRKVIIALIGVVAGGACLATVQRQIDALKESRPAEERLLYLPNERLLNHFTCGMSSVIADVLWLRCIQYTAMHFKTDMKFEWLDHMADVVTRLDPYFVAAYRYSGVFLAALKADDEASIELLKRGMRINPDTWQLPYEAGMIYLLNRRDWPDSRKIAGAYLKMAVETGKAPPHVAETAHGLLSRQNLFDVERNMWRKVLKSGDKLMRDLAKSKLTELNIRQNCAMLEKAAQIYKNNTGKPPDKLAQITETGILDKIPQDPLGGRYFIAGDGKVYNTSLLDQQLEQKRNKLTKAIDEFKQTHGCLPKSLQELRSARIIRWFPEHPYPGKTWQYNPDTGKVR